MILNLAYNAIKFTDAGSVRLAVAVVGAPSAYSARLRFTITDTGIGIPISARANLFEAFEQADPSLSRRFGGTGLGTTIAKGLTEAMGGVIGFESIEHSGSRFWVEVPFELPAAESSAEKLRQHETETHKVDRNPQVVTYPSLADAENIIAFSDPFLRHRARTRQMQILIADDHAANRMVLQGLLSKAGHRVVAVEDGESVLDAMSCSNYDVVIADLHMPGINGLDMIRQLRVMESGSARRTPVIVFSADVTPISIKKCEEAGAQSFLPKPIVAARLLDTLADIGLNGKVTTDRPQGRSVLMSNDEILDPGVLEELSSLGMGKTFEIEFIAQCFADAQNCIRLIELHGQTEQWEQMREQAHALKGVASNLGLLRLSSSAGEVMVLAEWQIAREWRQRLNSLRDRFAQGKVALAARADDRARADGDSGEKSL